MTKIVIDRDIPFLKGVFEPYAEVAALDGRSISRSDLADTCFLAVRTRTRCDAALLEGTPVRTVVTATIGTDHIDTEWCRSADIEVLNAAGCNARGVLQWVAAVLVHALAAQRLQPSQLTLGIVGVGNVGSLVERYARHWGFNVLCCDPPRQKRGDGSSSFVSLGDIFEHSDIVTLHVPLDGPEGSNFHLVGRGQLDRFKGRLLINSSRGEVVDTEALAASRTDFALDVWEHEPQPDARLLERALIATPHIAGYSLQGKANASARVVEAAAERLGMPLDGWYPQGVARTLPQMPDWEELCRTLPARYDILADSRALKSAPAEFENLRNGYRYREEFF